MSEEDHQGPLPRAALFNTEDSALADERTLEGCGATAMVGAMVGADHQLIEILEISAALSVDQSVSLTAARYAIASVTLDVALKKVENRNLYVLRTGGLYEASLEVLDAPPVLGTDDTLIIKQKVDGLFFAMRAVMRVERDRVLGITLNQVQPAEVH